MTFLGRIFNSIGSSGSDSGSGSVSPMMDMSGVVMSLLQGGVVSKNRDSSSIENEITGVVMAAVGKG